MDMGEVGLLMYCLSVPRPHHVPPNLIHRIESDLFSIHDLAKTKVVKLERTRGIARSNPLMRHVKLGPKLLTWYFFVGPEGKPISAPAC